MNGLLATTREKFSFSDRLRRNRHSNEHPKPLPKRQNLFLEPLESRLLLSVDFFAAAPNPATWTPPTNRADVGLTAMLSGVIEPAVSINTTDPGNVIVSSQRGLRASTNVGVDLISATTQPFAAVPTQTGPGGDTDTAFDSQGRLFWVNLVTFAGTQRDVVIGAVNPTNGASLAVPVRVPNGGALTDDKPFIAADANPLSPFADNLCVAFDRFGGQVANQQSVFFSRSTDHGVTWSTPILLSDFDGPNNAVDNGGDDEGFTWPADVKVAPNGDVYVAYHAQPDINDAEVEGAPAGAANPNGTSGKVFVLRSTNGGQTFTQKTQAFTDGQADVTYNRQSAGGLIPGTDFWMLGAPQPWVLPDPTRPGFVYVVSNDDPDNNHGNGDDGNIVFSRSGDNGMSWVTSTISAGPANSFQLFPTASIDAFGNIVVAWYDNRAGATNAGGNFLLDVFATYSTDGGVTWAPEFQVNNVALDPDIGAVNRFPGDPVATTRIGEYFGIENFGGTAHVAWNGPTPLVGTQTDQQVVYSTFAISGSLVVSGDDNGPTNDNFIIRRLATDSDFIEIFVNGDRQYAGLFEGLSHVTFNGLAGNDSLEIDSTNGLLSFANAIHYDGGTGFNRLKLTGTSAQDRDTYTVGPNPGEGTSLIRTGGTTQAVFFQNLAPVLDTVVATDLIVNATPADNTITYTAGAGGGLVTVDNFESIEFSNKAALTINAGDGEDRLIVQAPGAGAETAVYTPTAFDGGKLDLTSLGLLVTINTTEVLIYDGQGDNDSLTIVGTSGADTIVHTPGANDQAGSLQVNSLLALNYQNLGSGASLTVDGGAGTDTLVYNGTPADDLFTVNGSGQVILNSRLPVNTTSVETLTLQGLQGYDTVSLVGTGGNDSIIITGQAVRINGGITINANVEDIRLDALDGTDTITYNGVSGVSEDITVSSSGVAGGGQLSVPGETLVIFSGVEQIDVIGNTTETDTLTFAGTNAPDTFDINLAANVTTEPILQLKDSSGALLLTLGNYTKVNTLNVLGLDGADTFNVTVAPSDTSRNLFVDGGLSAGKKKSTDDLNIIYNPPKPKIIRSAATQDPDAGLVDLDYGTARFVVRYDDIEQVTIRKS
jgi:hypothetical protein